MGIIVPHPHPLSQILVCIAKNIGTLSGITRVVTDYATMPLQTPLAPTALSPSATITRTLTGPWAGSWPATRAAWGVPSA